MLNRIGQISINVHDLDRAVAFYRDALGMKLRFETGGMAFFDCGGIRLMLGPASSPEFDHPGSIIYYKVDDIQATHAAMVSKGVEFIAAPHLVARLPDHDLWLGFFKDPEGNTLALMSEMSSR